MPESEKTPLTRRESENRALGSDGKSLLVIVEGQDIDAMVEAGLEAIGGMGRIIGDNQQVVLKRDRIAYWLSVGAQPSDTVRRWP